VIPADELAEQIRFSEKVIAEVIAEERAARRRDARTVPIAPLAMGEVNGQAERDRRAELTPAATDEELAAPHVSDYLDDEEITIPFAAVPK
jgi:hypothetical protein